MKKTIFLLILSTILFVIFSFCGCQTPAEKVDDAEAKVILAKEALDKANREYQSDIETYRKEKAYLIAANDSSIVVYRTKIANERKDMKAGYEKNIAELEQKNRDLKRKMDDYNDEGKERWESFKREFNHDMDELGKALKDLTVNNKK